MAKEQDPRELYSLQLTAFEEAWQHRATPEIADYLIDAKDAATRKLLLFDLVKLDLELRWRRFAQPVATVDHIGNAAEPEKLPSAPHLEHYVACYSELGSLVELPDELIAWEFRMRWRWGDRPTIANYQQRFGRTNDSLWVQLEDIRSELETAGHDGSSRTANPRAMAPWAVKIRCPHCHNPVEILDNQVMTDITCPSCQSVFSLAGSVTGEADRGTSPRRFGHFELSEHLGAGAFGAVWKARDTQLDRTVAIKIPRRAQLDAADIEKFVREARAAAQLKHPNIVGIHEVGRDGDTVYIVSDFIAGLSLDKWLAGQHVTPKEAAELCRKIALALHHAHEAGVVHRDLKPSNIMIDTAGEPHVMDFGLAKREAGEITMTVEGQILGTPAYMSPEQAKGEGHAADRRSDVYSLGVILFELLTGERPFRGNVRMLLQQVLEDAPPSPRKLDARIPRDLETITLKCLEKDSTRRYPSARALADELQRFVEQKPIIARPIGRIARAWRWSKRNPVVASLLCLSIAFGLASLWTAAGESRQRKTAEQQIERFRRSNYNLHLTMAWQTFERSPDDAKVILEDVANCPWDLRDFTWRVLDRFCQGEKLKVFPLDPKPMPDANAASSVDRQASRAPVVAISPDEKVLAAGCADGRIMLFDIKSGNKQIAMPAHRGAVNIIAFSPDGRLLLTGGMDQFVKLWDRSETNLELRATRFLGDWGDTLSSQPSLKFPVSASFSPDGLLLAITTNDARLRAWNLASGAEHGIQPWALLKEELAPAIHGKAATFSADGLTMAIVSYDSMQFWSVANRKLLAHTPTSGACEPIAFAPDSKSLAVSTFNGAIRVLDVASANPIATLTGHRMNILSLAFSADGKTLASGGADGTLRLWDPILGQQRAVLYRKSGESSATPPANARKHTEATAVSCVTFSSGGTLLAAATTDGSVMVYQVSPSQYGVIDGNPEDLAFSPDERRLFVYDGVKVTILDAATGTLLRTPIYGSALQPGTIAQTIAKISGENESEVGLINLGSGAFSSKADVFAAHATFTIDSTDKEAILIWEPESGRFIQKIDLDSSSSQVRVGFDFRLSLSADGQTLAYHRHDMPSVHVCRVGTGTQWNIPKQPRTIALFPDGKRLAAGFESVVDIWDVRAQTRLLTLGGATFPVAISEDGKMIATAFKGGGGDIALWECETGKRIAEATTRSSLFREQELAFAPADLTLPESRDVGIAQFADKTIRQRVMVGAPLALSRNGKYLASGRFTSRLESHKPQPADDKVTNVWADSAYAYQNSRPYRGFGLGHPRSRSRGIACSPDGRWLFLGSLLWDTGAGKPLELAELTRSIQVADSVDKVLFSPDGRLLFITLNSVEQKTSKVMVFDLTTKLLVRERDLSWLFQDKPDRYPHCTGIWSSPDGTKVLLKYGQVLYDLTAQAVVRERTLPGSIAVSSDFSKFIDADGVRDATTNQLILSLKSSGPFSSAIFAPDGKYAITSAENNSYVWNLNTGAQVRVINGLRIGEGSAISPDGRLVVSSSMSKPGSYGWVREIWDINDGIKIVEIKGSIDRVEFAANNQYLLTSDSVGSGAIWDVVSGRQLCELHCGDVVGEWAVIDSEGRYDARNEGDMRSLYWQVGVENVSLMQLHDDYYEPELLSKVLGFNKTPRRNVSPFDPITTIGSFTNPNVDKK